MTIWPIFADNAGSTLAAPITNAQTSITVTSGSGALFPSPATGQFFPLTISVSGTPTTFEITWCTARSGDTLTVLRAQEGTTALAFNAGDDARNLITAGALAIGLLSFTPVQQGGGANQSSNKVFIGWHGAGGALRAQVDGSDIGDIAQQNWVSANFAQLAGLSTQVFNVANAATATEAVALGQFTATASGGNFTTKSPIGVLDVVFQTAVPITNGVTTTSVTLPINFLTYMAQPIICFGGINPPIGATLCAQPGSVGVGTTVVTVTTNGTTSGTAGIAIRVQGF